MQLTLILTNFICIRLLLLVFVIYLTLIVTNSRRPQHGVNSVSTLFVASIKQIVDSKAHYNSKCCYNVIRNIPLNARWRKSFSVTSGKNTMSTSTHMMAFVTRTVIQLTYRRPIKRWLRFLVGALHLKINLKVKNVTCLLYYLISAKIP